MVQGCQFGKQSLNTYCVLALSWDRLGPLSAYEGRPPKPGIYLKICVFILTYLNFSHLQSILHLMQSIHLLRLISTAQKFFNLLILMLFSASAILFHLFHIDKTFPFEDFFHPRKQKKLLRASLGWGMGFMPFIFGQKLLNTQRGVGRCTCKSPIVKWANVLSLQKEFTEAEHSLSQQRQLEH